MSEKKSGSLRRQIVEVDEAGDTTAGMAARNEAEDILQQRRNLEAERAKLEADRQQFESERKQASEKRLRTVEKEDKDKLTAAKKTQGNFVVDTGDIVVTYKGQHWGPGVVDPPDQESADAILRAVIRTRKERAEEELMRRTPADVYVTAEGEVRHGVPPEEDEE